MLGGLQRHVHAGQRAELARPHAGRVDDDLRLDLALLGADGGDPATVGLDPGCRDAFDHRGAELAGALGQRRRDAYRVGAALVGHVEPGQHIVGPGQRPHLGELARRDLGVLDAEAVHPGRLAPQRSLALRSGGHRDVADGPESRRVTSFGFQAAVQISRVPAEEERGLVGHPCRGDESRGVPGRPCREPVLLEESDIRPAQMGEVIGDAAAGHAATDNDDPGTARQGSGHACIPPMINDITSMIVPSASSAALS